MSGGVKRKYSWDTFAPENSQGYLKTYITEAKKFSEQIKEKYKKGLNKENVEEFRTFTNTSYSNLEDLISRALDAGELRKDKYEEISAVLEVGKEKCVEKVNIICSR